ncbi:MAG: hypothetical protein EXX96DRAFT_492892 [Benjaminiella poitrasii]|nr:MAG: hypothetical protein EXX96DRAFT_492892 [Benjaminiella poitrasii]
MLRMLAKEGFKVYLIDKYKTSSLCPSCHNMKPKTFKKVQNLRPFMRNKYATVACHDILS